MREKFIRYWPWWLLLAVSLWLHLWQLDARSFHHDESIHAKLSWDLANGGSYSYNPTYHGPLLYIVEAATFKLIGDNDFTARLPFSLVGVALLGVAWRLRRPFGERAAWWIGLLFTISPSILYFSRFLRMDVLELVTASAAFVAWYSVLRGSQTAWGWLGVWAGLAFATKENAYVTAALTVGAAGVLALVNGPMKVVPAAVSWLRVRWVGVILASGLFVLVTVPLYTVGFNHPEDWLFPVRSITYWWEQHSIQRVPGPWWFYLPRLLQYEFLIFGAALIWVGRRCRKLHPVELFLFVFGVGSVVMYIYLGEKVPWLMVHQVWAFIPLAGAQLARTFGPRGRWWSRTLAGTLLGATVLVSLVANFSLEEITPRQNRVESLHFVQTTPEFTAAAKEAGTFVGTWEAPRVAASGSAVWPLSWYWRQLEVLWAVPEAEGSLQLIICDPEEESELEAMLGQAWGKERIPLRSWWLMYEGEPSARDWLRYFLTRRFWGDIGSTEIIVFRRNGVR